MVDIIPSSQLVIGHGAFSIVYRAKLKSVSSTKNCTYMGWSGINVIFFIFFLVSVQRYVVLGFEFGKLIAEEEKNSSCYWRKVLAQCDMLIVIP